MYVGFNRGCLLLVVFVHRMSLRHVCGCVTKGRSRLQSGCAVVDPPMERKERRKGIESLGRVEETIHLLAGQEEPTAVACCWRIETLLGAEIASDVNERYMCRFLVHVVVLLELSFRRGISLVQCLRA